MEYPYQSVWLFASILLGCEYGLKQWFESLPSFRHRVSVKSYAFLRGAIFVLLYLAFLVCFAFSPTFIFAAVIASAIALVELPMGWLQQQIFSKTASRFRLIQLVPFLLLALFSVVVPPYINAQPRLWVYHIIERLPLGFAAESAVGMALLGTIVMLAHPANMVVRILVNKGDDRFVSELVFEPHEPIRLGNLEELAKVPETEREGSQIMLETAAAHEQGGESSFPYGQNENPEWNTLRAGRIIGVLERWIILLLILIGEFGLLGFVLTAKSIARFKQFEIPSFAEYYLLGTLYSTLIALVAGLYLRTVL